MKTKDMEFTKDMSLTFHEVYDEETGKSLLIKAETLNQAIGISETIDFNDFEDGEEIIKTKDMEFTKKQIEELKKTHEKIRNILMDYGNVEFGDCIIDEISILAGIPPTTVYYEE